MIIPKPHSECIEVFHKDSIGSQHLGDPLADLRKLRRRAGVRMIAVADLITVNSKMQAEIPDLTDDVRIPEKATTLSGAWRPRDPVDDDQGGARA